MRYFIIFLLLFIVSCSSDSSNKKDNVENKLKQTSNESTKINTDYKYEKLDVANLYSDSDKDILKEIDLSHIKNIKNSLLYSESSKVYIERSPLEVYELLVKKADKRTIQDEILFLKISLELGKNENINNILKKLKSSNLVISDIKEVNGILARFDLFNEEVSFISYKLDKLLNKNKKFNEYDNSRFLTLIDLIKSIETTNLTKIDKNKFFNKYLKIDRFNETINSEYINNLIDTKKYSEVEKFINALLTTIKNEKISYNKKSLLTSLVLVYNKTKQNSKIRDLYLLNTKLPENKELFYEYIKYLKSEKIWSKELKYFITKFDKEKSLDSFYRYYFALKYENKNIENLLVDYYKYLLKNKNDEAVKDLSKLLKENGNYKEAFNLLNIALINNKNSKYYDDYLITMGKVIEGLPYTEEKYKSYYFFSAPEIIGGILSLIQNQHKNNDFLTTIDNQNNIKTRIEDMNYLFENNKKVFKSNEKLAIFAQNYFYFLKNYKQANKIKKLVAELRKLNKDIYFNIFLLKTTKSFTKNNNRIATLNNEIYNLYLKLLLKNNNNKDKFNKYLSETLSFLNNFESGKAISKLNNLIKVYPNNERIYEKLLVLLGNYRAYNKKLVVYEKALEKFNKKTWADKYSRFLIRRKWNEKMVSLNKRLINLLNKDDYQQYLTSSFSSKKYGSFTSPFNQLYEQVYVDALKKYPFNLVIINKLLYFYNDFRYSYSYKNSNASYKYALLLYKYIYIYDDFRDRYFKDRLITKKMNHDKIINNILKKKKKTIPDLKYLAYMLEYKGEFEKSVKYYSILSRYYITNKNIIFKTAKLYKSLASSFYIKDKSFLKKSEVLYKRLSFLYRNESKYYISLAELYYELMMKNKAEKILFRALQFEKGSEQKYIDIANMFYEYYDYDNALKTIYIYRKRKANNNLLIPFVGRLFELKKQEKLAIKEYFRDLLNEKSDSYQSEERLKSLINKKSLKDLIILNIEGNISNVSNNEVLFNKFKAFLISINNNKLLAKLYDSLYEDGNNISLLKQLYYIFKENKDTRAEEVLKKIEKLENSDEVYRMLISFYKEKKNVKEASDYYEKLLLSNPFENDKYSFINIIEDYASYLIKNKEYEGAINKYNDLLVYIKNKDEKLKYKLNIADIYKLQSGSKYLNYLLKLDSEYPNSNKVSNKIFSYYKENNKIKEMLSYLKELIKRTKKESRLSYTEKKERIAEYRNLLIEQLVALKKYNSVLDQYIEILNRNPLDTYMAKKVYNFAILNKIEARLFDYYSKLSEKSFKNHKYLLLNAQLNSLKGDYSKTLLYYQKAEKLEPQELEIKYNIASTFIKLKEYSKAYNLYNALYLKEQDKYTKKYLLKKMFEVSMYLNNTKLIEDLAFRIAKNYSDNEIKYVAQTLYKHNYPELARNYYDKLIMETIKSNRYIDKDIFYQYSRTFIDKGEGLLLIKRVFELLNELNSLDIIKYKYDVNKNKDVLFAVITEYIPENISYFTASEINSINSYLDSLGDTYNSYLSQYYKKMNLMDKYFSKLTGSDVKNTKYNYYRAALDYDSIINQGLYKAYGYNKIENKTLSNYGKAFWYYVWKDKNTAFSILENNILKCDTYNKNTNAVIVYIEFLRKSDINKYKNLTKNTCIYNEILAVYIKYSEKKLALELINNQKHNKIWKLTQKINLYWVLKEFNKEGVDIYNELLSTDLSISDELERKMLLKETEWNNLINRYSNYLLKSNLTSNLDNYINNILEVAPKSVKAYLTVADIYNINKRYKKSIEYLNYASQVKNKMIINIKLADNYLKLGKLDKFSKIKAKILKSSNLNSFYKFYEILRNNKKLDNYFISVYSDLLIKNYKTYGYYKLRSFIKQITNYYENKNITVLASFVDNFKDGKYEIYKSILVNNKASFSNDYKIKLFDKIISYYSEIKDDYSKKTLILAKVEFLSILKKYNIAIEILSKYKQFFEYEDKSKYNFYMFKLYYLSENLDFAKKLFTSQLNNNDYSEYGIDKYFNFLINNEKFKKEFLLNLYTELRASASFSKDNLIKVLAFFKDNSKLKVEVLYLINNFNLSQSQLSSLERLTSKRNLSELYNLILENKYSKFYSDYNYKKMYHYNYIYSDTYYLYVINLIKLNKITKLKKVINDRKLSVSELYLINTKINEYSTNEKNAMLLNLNFENTDIYYIKALLNYSLKKYEMALTELNKIDTNNDYKYNLDIPLLKVNILSKLNQVNDLGELKKAIKASPYNNDLKYILFEYYLKNKKNEKAMFVLGEMGANLYLVFDNIVAEDFKYLSLNNYSSEYSYEDNYYDYYEPEKLAEKAFGTVDKDNNNYIENFISKYSDKQRKTIVKFLYEQYQKVPKNKKLGLSILYSYSKLDKSYKKEYNELKESK